MAKVYGPTQAAQNNPRRVYLKEQRKWIGVGGKIEINRKAPKRSTTVPEATEAEYKFLYEKRNFTNLIVDLNDENVTENDLIGQ